MTPTEQDKELRALLGEMPYFVIDWLELSDDLRHEWKKGGKASDFGGQRAFIQKYEKKLADFITADRKRVALEARIDPFDFVESCEPDCDDVRHAYHQGQWDMATRIKAQQEEK